MPSSSAAQHRAMEAAAHGGSTLGIPKKVGEEFVAADGDFEESKHPRAPDGKFGPGGGGKPPLKTSELKKQGGKLGTNEGGTYVDGEGKRYYVKHPPSKAHVANELAAARLYNLAGAKTLTYRDVEGGEHVATEWQVLDKNNVSQLTPEERREAVKDFAVHAWLGNYDAAGTGGDNQGYHEGRPVTLDVGGSLRFRAQGAPKGKAFGPKVREIDSMRGKDPEVHAPDAAGLFGKMTEKELKSSVRRVASIPDDDIREAVGGDDELADILIERKRDMARRFDVAMDSALLAFDRAHAGVDRWGMAFDRGGGSVRSIDEDGRMRVSEVNISKACVNPYLGEEIPRWRELGLAPKRIYKMLRDPDELRRAAATFDGVPLLGRHVPTTAKDHKHADVTGAIGTGTRFEDPYLKTSLIIWTDQGIRWVESNKKRELSSAYRYRPDMTPGTYKGEKYDGVMRDIVGNHVAQVEDGRAGSDVVVGDSRNPKLEKTSMPKKILSRKALQAQGALMAHLSPMLASDAQIDLSKALAGVTARNFGSRKPKILTAVEAAIDGKLAQDASLEGLEGVLNMIEKAPGAEDEPPEADPKADKNGRADDEMDDMDDEAMDEEGEDLEDEEEKRKKAAKEAKDKKAKDAKRAKDKAAKDAMAKAAKDKAAKDAANEADEDEPFEEAEAEDARAMDARIKREVRIATDAALKTAADIRSAEKAVRPYVGDFPEGMAFDSAAAVYRKALVTMGMDARKLADVSLNGLKLLLEAKPRPGTEARSHLAPAFSGAMDSATVSGFNKRFPSASKIGHA